LLVVRVQMASLLLMTWWGIMAGGSQQVGQDTDRQCAMPSTDPGARWVALGLQHTGFGTWRILWSQPA
jgi:hypothetical protein